MNRIRSSSGNGQEHRRRVFDFTVILLPIADELPSQAKLKPRKPASTNFSGYQVTVPLLPGVITYGRTEEEAIEMARDAIRCHLDGLRKSGEEIPDEKKAHTAKLRVALST
ncbi:MAG: type II toxin-antitoxin system HicB family antitoxin [Candidatus Acidiferrales bacterium]